MVGEALELLVKQVYAPELWQETDSSSESTDDASVMTESSDGDTTSVVRCSR